MQKHALKGSMCKVMPPGGTGIRTPHRDFCSARSRLCLIPPCSVTSPGKYCPLEWEDHKSRMDQANRAVSLTGPSCDQTDWCFIKQRKAVGDKEERANLSLTHCAMIPRSCKEQFHSRRNTTFLTALSPTNPRFLESQVKLVNSVKISL